MLRSKGPDGSPSARGKSTETRDLPELFLPPPFDAAALRARHPRSRRAAAARAACLARGLRTCVPTRMRSASRWSPDSGGRVAGVLVSLPPAARDRFDFALAVIGARAVPVRAEAEGGAVAAEAYVFDEAAAPEGPWPGGPCPEERRARFAEALAEVMGHFGRRDASEVRALLHGIGIRALARARGAAGAGAGRCSGRGLGAADVEPIDARVLLRPLLRDGGAPPAAPPLRRDDVGGDRPRGLHQRRRDHRPAVRPAAPAPSS